MEIAGLPVVIADDEAGVQLLDGPGRWETTSGQLTLPVCLRNSSGSLAIFTAIHRAFAPYGAAQSKTLGLALRIRY